MSLEDSQLNQVYTGTVVCFALLMRLLMVGGMFRRIPGARQHQRASSGTGPAMSGWWGSCLQT